MGLDMYLFAEKSLNNQESCKQIRSCISQAINTELGCSLDLEPSIESVTLRIAYWRKAYAIDSWFNKNSEYYSTDRGCYVSFDTLDRLHQAVTSVLADHSLADQLLPSREGDHSYNSVYFAHLEYTQQQLESMQWLRGNNDWMIYYKTSY